jgi:D-alanyl-D-alanine carboxypeptidase
MSQQLSFPPVRPLALAAVLALAACAGATVTGTATSTRASAPEIRRVQTALVRAYPGVVRAAGRTRVQVGEGPVLAIDDLQAGKTPEVLEASPDLHDMFHWAYPAMGAPASAPVGDPGRIRHQAFFDQLYGDCERGEVSGQLVPVRWFTGASIQFHSAHGAAAALQAVSDELARLPAEVLPAASALAGSYNCRRIAGTTRRSMHAYGIAVDLSTAHGEYWRWDRQPERNVAWRNRFPIEIVQLFERHGFIWGGRWSHYDTFHFEYRPEFAAYAAAGRPRPHNSPAQTR